MEYVPKDISDEDLIAFAKSWLSVLAKGNVSDVIERLGYGMSSDPHPDDIYCRVDSYRSEQLFPGEDKFVITEWSEAKGGNPEPLEDVIWFTPVGHPLAAAISLNLPLNGKWSDLQIDFVLFDAGKKGYAFRIEEICPHFG